MIKNKHLLAKEQDYNPITWATTLSCAITGFITYIFDSHNIWLQWTVLFHLITGITASVLLLIYLVLHFRRTLGFRRISVIISGLFTLFLYLGFVYTGWLLMFEGQQENTRWIYNTHIVSGSLFLALILLHLLLHVTLLPKRRQQNDSVKCPSIPYKTFKYSLLYNILLQVIITVIAFSYQASLTPYKDTPAVADYEFSYGEHRFRPSQTETFNNAFIDQRQIANSHRCFSCHKEISEQWLSSAHQQAANDPTYVTNVSLLADEKGISATRYCEGCHAPVALLTGELSKGGRHGGIKGTPANIEGVSCLGCHGISALTHLKGVASFEFTPMQDYLFAQSRQPLLMRLHNLLLSVKPEQHKKDLGKPLFTDSKFCSSCHSQFMDKDMNGWGWVNMQNEYAAWLESPYSKQHQEGFSTSDEVRCQDCHMPLLSAADPSADLDGKIRSHNFPGANTLLPLLRGDKKQLEATIKFLQSSKLRVSIDKPNRKDAVENLLAIDESIRNLDEAPYYLYIGEKAKLTVAVSNRGVGHNFPGGSIDINQAWLEFLVMDAQGVIVFNSGLLDNNNYVDPDAYFYRSLPIDRQGQLVWKHDLFNRVGESFRRVIKAGESDIVRYSFEVPAWVKSPLTVTATLKYRKLNERYAKWALKDQYVKIPVVDLAWSSLAIPIKIRKEVEITK